MERCKVDEDTRAYAEREGRKDDMDAAKEREIVEIAESMLDGSDLEALTDCLREKMNPMIAYEIRRACEGKYNRLDAEVREVAWDYAADCVKRGKR